MKTKNVKKLALTCLATAFLACGSIGLVVADFETSAATESIGSFEMVGGASIRTVSGTTGIRYTAKFDETLYNVVTEDDDKQFGMIITKLDYYLQAKAANSDLIAGLDSLGANKYVLISESSANPCTPYLYTLPSGETEYRVSGALTNIKYSNADSTWMGVGVVITGNGDEQDTYEYAKTDETNARTTAYVATAALNDEAFGYKDYEKDVMRDYVYEYTAKVSGLDEATFDAQEDKSANLNGLTIALGDGIDTTEKYNQNVAGKETYLTINEKETVDIAVTTADGKALDFACETTSSDSDVVKVENFNQLKPLKNGYTTLTVSSTALGDWSETVTAYVGSESVVKLTETEIFGWSGAQGGYHSSSETGTIKGEEYYGYAGKGSSAETIQFWAYSDALSVYYIDYMIAQGYTHVRMPFYVDTSLSHELFEGVSESDKATSQKIRAQFAQSAAGVATTFTDTAVDLDEWIYWDMDINHYRAHFAETDTVDTYGVKSKVTEKWYYANALFMNVKNSLVYFGEQTFVKNSTYAVNEESASATFGETVTLSDKFTSNLSLAYAVDSVAVESLVAVYESQAISINANVYTHTINDSKNVVVSKSADVTKTLIVSDGIKAVNLVDVNGMADTVAFADYTKTAQLQALGWTVDSVTYEKRYAASDYEQAATIATTERGIFYANMTVSKNEKTLNIPVALDLYDSTEPVEYESFGHDDSSYAVKVYYYAGADNYKSYETVKTTYGTDKGMDMTIGSFGTAYVSLLGYGEVSKTVDGLTSYADDTGTTVSSLYGHTDIHYVCIDQKNITTTTPLTVATNDNKANINVYVTPRHTKEYYALFAETNTGKLKFTYAAGSSSGSQATRCSGLTSVNNGVGTLTQHSPWSGNWQYKDINNAQTITLSTIVNNYESFNSMAFPIFISEDPQGRHSSQPANGYAKLGSLLF